MKPSVCILVGDVTARLQDLPAASVHCVVTSPPYWGLRTYLPDDHPAKGLEMGAEPTPEEYIRRLADVFDQVRRVLRPDGTMWVNIGDSRTGSGGAGEWSQRANLRQEQTARAFVQRRGNNPNRSVEGLADKQLVGIPWRLALELQRRGWWWRSNIVWHKPNPTPGSAKDRPQDSHEAILLFAPSEHYYYDAEGYREPTTGNTRLCDNVGGPKTLIAPKGAGNNPSRKKALKHLGLPDRACRDVWEMNVSKFSGEHFAGFPPELPRRCILLGTSAKGCCPACGAPWQRVVQRERLLDREPCKTLLPMRTVDKHNPSSAQGVGHARSGTRTVTLGWTAGCDCNAGDPIPCTVLDPFLGAGTTAIASLQLGRSCVGIELYNKYANMARRRITGIDPLLRGKVEMIGQPADARADKEVAE